MSKAQIEFLQRCKALNLHSGSLNDWLDRIEAQQKRIDELKELHESTAFNAKYFKQRYEEQFAEIAELREANRIACEDLAEQQNLRVAYGEQIAELVEALESVMNDSGLVALMWTDQIDRNNHALAKVRRL